MAEPLHEEGHSYFARYSPWPGGTVYKPGQGDAPNLHGQPRYGEPPEVGDVPRIGSRSGDPRCRCNIGPPPCSFCVTENVPPHDDIKVMPGIDEEAATGKHPVTGMPWRSPHPNWCVTKEMNTGRGCDTFGKAYNAPPRYERIQVFKYDADDGGYRKGTSLELDFGPAKGSQEFKAAMKAMRETPEFKEWEQQKRGKDEEWAWRDPVEPKPWESVEKVDPNPWLATAVAAKEPAEEHAAKVHAWAKQEHAAWPEAPED